MTKPRLISSLILIVAVMFGMQSAIHADNVSITDGTNSFAWDPDTGTTTVTSIWGDYIPLFEPMLRYVSPVSGLNTFTMADFDPGGVTRDVVSNSASGSGATGSQHVDFDTQSGLSSPVPQFDVDIAFGISSNMLGAVVNYSMTVTNTSGATRTGVELFSYYDWDLLGNQNSGEDWILDGFTGFKQTASVDTTARVFHGTDNFENWEVADWDTIESKLLTNGDLTNTGTPYGVDDMTAAFGWDIGTMTAGQSFTVNMMFQGVPEPSSCVLMIGLLGFGFVRRRAR